MKRMLTVGLLMIGWLAGSVWADGDLAANFATPPASARPWVYGFPLNGNLTKEGITADLEAMARVGIGGVLYMEVDQGAPKGGADFAGPLWREMIQHACKEANRLGIEINMNNDAGWCGSGGPWITPELSMQIVVWTETMVEGGKPFEGALAKPLANKGFYQDIAVLAMPAPGDDKFRKVAAAAHYNGLMGKVIADNKALTGRGKVLVSTHIDSWEVGTQNWTPKMREEFKNRRGYDLWKCLPAFTGRVIDSAEVTERFLWDLRQTISDLIVESGLLGPVTLRPVDRMDMKR